MKIKYHSIDPLTIDLETFLTDRGLNLSDVDDVVFMIKSRSSDEDIAAVVTKTLADGVSINTSQNTITILLDYDDYGDGLLELSKKFKMGMGIKTPSLTKYLEPSFEDNILYIERDFIHD